MSKSILTSLLILVFVSFLINTEAQESKYATLATIGVSTPILDNGVGIHIGLNPNYELNRYFALEGQVSYIYTTISGTFLSGNSGFSNTINMLVGGRIYFMPSEKNIRFYINGLVGVFYLNEHLVNASTADSFFGPGLSGGGFLEINDLVLGVSFDTAQNLILKAGYQF